MEVAQQLILLLFHDRSQLSTTWNERQNLPQMTRFECAEHIQSINTYWRTTIWRMGQAHWLWMTCIGAYCNCLDLLSYLTTCISLATLHRSWRWLRCFHSILHNITITVCCLTSSLHEWNPYHCNRNHETRSIWHGACCAMWQITIQSIWAETLHETVNASTIPALTTIQYCFVQRQALPWCPLCMRRDGSTKMISITSYRCR